MKVVIKGLHAHIAQSLYDSFSAPRIEYNGFVDNFDIHMYVKEFKVADIDGALQCVFIDKEDNQVMIDIDAGDFLTMELI